MRLKSKYVTLVALIMLTATPRALNQLTDLKNFAQDRFRAELLNIFWGFTTPESRRDSARQTSEFLARVQAATTGCNGTDEIAGARTMRAASRAARWTPHTFAFESRQPTASGEQSSDNHIAAAQTNQDVEFNWTVEPASLDTQKIERAGEQETVAVLDGNQRGRAPFAEAATLPRIDDAIAQLDLGREALAEALPAAKPAPLLKREIISAQRLAQKFVQTNFQIRLPENLEQVTSDRAINSDALIKVHDALAPSGTKCRVRVLRLAPEAPRPLEKPATIS